MNGKRVRQLTLSGEIVAEYPSATEGAKTIGGTFGSVARVCHGERNSYKGYKWEYIDDNQ